MSAADRLFAAPPFPRRPRPHFRAALRETAARQEARFPVLRALYARERFRPAALKSERAIRRIPFLHVSVFKENDFRPASPFKAALTLTSSGTGGQKSRIVLDAGSLRRVKEGAKRVYGALGMVDKTLVTDYLCFTYDPRQARDLGTAFTDELLTSFTARGRVHYAISRPRPGADFRFDLEGTLKALREMAAGGRPLRVLGFPAHVLFTMQAWRERGWAPLRLGKDSWVMTGGGWKGHQGDAIPKGVFKAAVSAWLGLPAANIRDLYGLVEHGVPYVECRRGRMHVPDYARVFVRDPKTLKILPYGRKGLLHLITPYLTSFPSYSVLASDWGSLAPRCSCGTPGAVLTLHGRAGKSPAKGCAVTAAELLK